MQLGAIGDKLLKLTKGRTTAFFVAFFLAGHAMAFFGKLTDTYVGYMIGLGGLVLAHSAKEDWAAAKKGQVPPGGDDANKN